MTKLMEWMFCLTIFLGVWTAAVTGKIESPWVANNYLTIVYLPVIFLFIFAVYAATTVLYRTFTFNNCEGAAKQLKREIQEAQAELRIKGVLQRDPKGPELM